MLTVENVDLFYGAAQALKDVSMQSETGKVTCVIGRNGVGKTSLMRAVVGQQPLTRDAVKWDGKDISKMPVFERARHGIAFVPQGREIFPLLTVEENLETGDACLSRGQRRVPDEAIRRWRSEGGLRAAFKFARQLLTFEIDLLLANIEHHLYSVAASSSDRTHLTTIPLAYLVCIGAKACTYCRA